MADSVGTILNSSGEGSQTIEFKGKNIPQV